MGFSEDEITELVAVCDANGDGHICYEEFTQLLGAERRAAHGALPRHAPSPRCTADLAHIWRTMCDTGAEAEELQKLMFLEPVKDPYEKEGGRATPSAHSWHFPIDPSVHC